MQLYKNMAIEHGPISDRPYQMSIEALVAKYQTDLEGGLTSNEVKRRRNLYGLNLLKKQKNRSRLSIFLDQFADPMIYILLAASVAAVIFEEWLEAGAIAVVILITCSIGFLMEVQAIKSMEALRTLFRTQTRAIRDGKSIKIPSEELVPGDLIVLEEGDVVPADARIVHNQRLGVKEDILTGESGQVDKTCQVQLDELEICDQRNMLFSGTIISRGTGRAIVTATGSETAIGQVEELSREATSTKTPLDKKLILLNRHLINICLGLVIIVFGVGVLRGKDLYLMIETSIALAVAAIPEGLPIVATVALARGMLKLAKKNVIIKKMEAVQTLGEMGIILTDKTGTLTENKMVIHDIFLRNLSLKNWTPDKSDLLKHHPDFERLILTAILCNSYNLEREHGDPLEKALFRLAKETDIDTISLKKQFSLVEELPFDSNIRMMMTLHKREKEMVVSAKGAAEEIISKCHFPADEYSSNYWHTIADRMAAGGLRTLAFASKKLNSAALDLDSVSDLEFIGLIGFLDAPRADVKSVIDAYHQSGIRVIMVTGDHPNTAKKVAEDIGLFEQVKDPATAVISGKDLPALDKLDPSLENNILQKVIFARVLPVQKLQIVDFFQRNNYIVGMTGDGVNDAPALKKSDVGIAMGIRGTEAAKDVADIILKDDRFASIQSAIYQGRTIFENIRKFVVYLMSSNFAEIAVVAFASFSDLPQPLLPLQILFLNMVTDVFPALALSMTVVDGNILNRPPRPADEPIMTKYHWKATAIYGFSIAIWVTAINIYGSFFLRLDPVMVNNMAFYTLVLSQLFNLFNLPEAGLSPLVNELSKNIWIWVAISLSIFTIMFAQQIPTFAVALTLVDLAMEHYLIILLFSFSSFIFAQLLKNTLRI
ncbi:MAG: cation-transporting P-type ATPase [Saprospiraceae bacterium]|nr:cation-transporting P-type ATPase [Saprospiraceae bacterium]